MRDVLSSEVITVVPLNTFTHVQRVDCGVVVYVPALKQHAFERTVGVVLHEVLKPTGGDVGHLGPVKRTRVLQGADFHLHPDFAALLGVACGCRRCRANQRIGSGCAYTEGGGPNQKFTAIEQALLELTRIHFRCGVQLCFGLRHYSLPVTHYFLFTKRAVIFLAVFKTVSR